MNPHELTVLIKTDCGFVSMHSPMAQTEEWLDNPTEAECHFFASWRFRKGCEYVIAPKSIGNLAEYFATAHKFIND